MTEAKAGPASECIVDVGHDARNGVWLTRQKAVELFQGQAQSKELARQVEALTKAYDTRTAQAVVLQKAFDESQAATEAAKKETEQSTARAQAADKALQESEARAASVFRSPLLWLGVGAALGGFIVLEVKK